MNPVNFLILILATWRISSLLTNDEEGGPWDILDYLRENGRKISGAFECLWCMSVWVGVGLTISFWFFPEYTTWACFPFALSGGAIALDRWSNG